MNIRFYASFMFLTVLSSQAYACFPCIEVKIPGLPPVTLTPVGPAPTVVVKKADEIVNKTVPPVAKAIVAQPVAVVGVISGQQSLGDAAKSIVKSQGNAIESVGYAVSATNAAANGVTILAAQSIGGDVGKTVVTIGTGTNRLTVEFAATAAIQAGKLVGGKISAETLIAEPLAAGIRAAERQFEAEAKPLPADVRAKLGKSYPADVIDKARWTVGSVSISVPDVTNQARLIFAGVENAVTVGHVTVFVRDPESNYHWWAHELQHQVQYHDWGIDNFAYRYVTACHAVEQDAENKAQLLVPYLSPVGLGC